MFFVVSLGGIGNDLENVFWLGDFVDMEFELINGRLIVVIYSEIVLFIL